MREDIASDQNENDDTQATCSRGNGNRTTGGNIDRFMHDVPAPGQQPLGGAFIRRTRLRPRAVRADHLFRKNFGRSLQPGTHLVRIMARKYFSFTGCGICCSPVHRRLCRRGRSSCHVRRAAVRSRGHCALGWQSVGKRIHRDFRSDRRLHRKRPAPKRHRPVSGGMLRHRGLLVYAYLCIHQPCRHSCQSRYRIRCRHTSNRCAGFCTCPGLRRPGFHLDLWLAVFGAGSRPRSGTETFIHHS